MSNGNDELLAELARRVEARERAGDYERPWLRGRAEEIDPPTPVDAYLRTPRPSLRDSLRAALTPAGDRSSPGEADLRLREAISWLNLALDMEGASRERVDAELRARLDAELRGFGASLRALGDSVGERLHRLEDDRRWAGSRDLRAGHPDLAQPEQAPGDLTAAERRVYSQNGEDGIIAWLLSAIGPTDRRFVEIGIGDGRECNTAALAIVFGWRGLMIDAWPAGVAAARAFYESRPETRDTVAVALETITAENADALLAAHGYSGDLDLLSIDIDGNDLWVWQAIESPRPRIVVIEYNATFGPERSVSVPYDPAFDRLAHHESGWYHGASLAALDRVARQKGYVLAGCDSNGVNAFFVRGDLAAVIDPVDTRDAWRPVRERGPRSTAEQYELIAHLPLVEIP